MSRIYLSIFIMAGVTYQVVGNKWAATALSVSRQGLFYIPLIFVLPKLFHVTGLECLQAVSDALSFLFALPFTFYFFRTLRKLQTEKAQREQGQEEGELALAEPTTGEAEVE